MNKALLGITFLTSISVFAVSPQPTITPLEDYFNIGESVKIESNIVIAENSKLTKFSPQRGIKCELTHEQGEKRVIKAGETFSLDSVNRYELYDTDSSYYTATVIVMNEIRMKLSDGNEDLSLNCLRLIGHKDNSRVSEHGLYERENVVVSNVSSNMVPTPSEINSALEYIITMPSL